MPDLFPVTVKEFAHVRLFGATVRYVDGTNGSDANDGHCPTCAFATIQAAIDASASGDGVNVTADTYTEEVTLGVLGSKDYLELWCEIGTILTSTAGTPLTIAGSFCKVNQNEDFLVVKAAADQVGVSITGPGAHVKKVQSISTGLAITAGSFVASAAAVGVELERCRGTGVKAGSASFDTAANQFKILECTTVGIAASTGYKLSGTITGGILDQCTSAGHSVAPFDIGANVTGVTILSCSSGAGDGARAESVAGANVWSNYTFADTLYAITDFSVVGGGTHNLFKVTGVVNITGLKCHVDTQISADVDLVQYTLVGTGDSDITDTVDSASAIAGSLFAKEKKTADALILYDSADSEIIEEVDLKKTVFEVKANPGIDTYIAFTSNGVATSGVLHHDIKWEPVIDGSFVEVA